MTKSTGERLSRACIRCRKRKTKCDLKYTGDTYRPCSNCFTKGQRCILATSRRGGDYSRFRRRGQGLDAFENREERTGASVQTDKEDGGEGLCGGVQNPLEALQILAQTASSARHRPSNPIFLSDSDKQRRPESGSGLNTMELVRDGILEISLLQPLLQHYIHYYHPYLPILPTHLLSLEIESWAKEPFLLAAVLTIASKDRPDLEHVHNRLLGHMEKLLLRVVLGAPSVRHVSSVEGLLLLAEWVPHLSSGMLKEDVPNNATESGQANEDSVAWNIIGMAVRQAYLLHLENYSFRGETKGEIESVLNRRRLAWIFTYLADRQISIQMGQAFWCRGPGLSTRFTVDDYPSLRPQNTGGIDYASFIQAQVELTTLFGNIHDILYASKTRTVQLMLMGDYTKYLDDSAKALAMWRETWASVDIPAHLEGLLVLQFEYLRLYINAFAFQAVLYRSSKGEKDTGKTVSYFPYSVMASPDGRHIYISIDAAQSVLRKLLEKLNASKHLRYLPVRYYLYEIHASVFLFKASSVGALTSDEQQTCSTLVRQFISMLKFAATSPKHIASRYSKLLTSLWFQGQVTPDVNQQLNQSSGITQSAQIEPTSNEIFPDDSPGLLDGANVDNMGLQSTVPDLSTMSFLGTEGFDFADSFLTNLPFLRGFPDLDESGLVSF